MAVKPDTVRPRAIFLMGPTASGKSELALLLCERLQCEIISVDSTAVYRGLDIGSAKPDAATRARVPHHLLDIRAPQSPYSAADFRSDALLAMQDITQRGKTPLLVGGTMLYYKALLEGLADLPAADPEIRAEIAQQAAAIGWPSVHAELALVDPDAAARLHPNDPQRVQRALEVYRSTGISLTEWHRRQQQSRKAELAYSVTQLAVAPRERTLLHQRIEQRFREMLSIGLVEEVKQLLTEIPSQNATELPALKAVGYRQVCGYLANQYDHAEMIERSNIATRQLAKRQLTWLRSWSSLRWLYLDQTDFENDFNVTNNTANTPSVVQRALKLIDPVTT